MTRSEIALADSSAATERALRERGWVHLVVCGCGQELDRCQREHCPRCGSTLRN
jgi:rRNA maturation endonuclease Nob1